MDPDDATSSRSFTSWAVPDAWIAKHLGMDKDEILRLKQITGLTALFKDVKFVQAWQPMDEEDGDESENGDDALLG